MSVPYFCGNDYANTAAGVNPAFTLAAAFLAAAANLLKGVFALIFVCVDQRSHKHLLDSIYH